MRKQVDYLNLLQQKKVIIYVISMQKREKLNHELIEVNKWIKANNSEKSQKVQPHDDPDKSQRKTQ